MLTARCTLPSLKERNMSCFSLPYIEQLIIWLIIACAVWAIIKLLIPLIPFALPAQILTIVLWVVIALFVVYFIFGLLGCVGGPGGLSLVPRH